MNEYHQPLLPNHTYHLFSRAVGSEKLFIEPKNYLFFLNKLKLHTSSVCSFYCYSLLPNHFHLMVRIHEEGILIQHFEEVKKKQYQADKHDISDFVMERFSNFLNSYTKSFNKVYNRKGALFIDYMKRSQVRCDEDFTAFVWYVHKNVVHHSLAKKIGEWTFDSYNTMLSEAPTVLLRQDILDWFGDKEAYIKFHQQEIQKK